MTRIAIYKAQRRLYLFEGNTVTEFPVALGKCPVGTKRAEGDGKTPEGTYFVCVKNPRSKYYLSLGISYPNMRDTKAALEEGHIGEDTFSQIERAQNARRRPPWDTPLGGYIMLHGGGIEKGDWTAGCVALNDSDMDILFAACEIGTEVAIFP